MATLMTTHGPNHLTDPAQFARLCDEASAERAKDRNRSSVELWLRARELVPVVGATTLQAAEIESSLAFNFVALGLADHAVEHATAAVELAAGIDDRTIRLKAAGALALTQTRLGHFGAARRAYRRLLADARRAGDRRELWRTCVNFGVCLADEARQPNVPDDRRRQLRQRILTINAVGRRLADGEVEALYNDLNDVDTLIELGRIAEADVALSRCETVVGERDLDRTEPLLRLESTQLRAVLQLRSGESAAAVASLRAVLSLAEALGTIEDLPRWLDTLSEAEEQAGDLRAALQSARRSALLRLQIARAESGARLRVVEVRQQLDEARLAADAFRRRAEEHEQARRGLETETLRLVAATRTDPLTGLGNRRRLDDLLAEIDQSSSLGLVVLDLDHFKQVNDRFSHQVGDRVLVEVGRLLRKACREGDLVVRFGGEEIAVVVVDQVDEMTPLIAERLRRVIETFDWSTTHPGLTMTASVGFAVATRVDDFARALAQADRHLYDAKDRGRNRVCGSLLE